MHVHCIFSGKIIIASNLTWYFSSWLMCSKPGRGPSGKIDQEESKELAKSELYGNLFGTENLESQQFRDFDNQVQELKSSWFVGNAVVRVYTSQLEQLHGIIEVLCLKLYMLGF